MKYALKGLTAALAAAGLSFAAHALDASVPADGVYKFVFGVNEGESPAGTLAVPASAVCDVSGPMAEGRFSYGFLGTTDTSYTDDVPKNLPTVPHAIDGFKVVRGQKIVLRNATDMSGLSCVTGPAAGEYLPKGASTREGRYPVRFSMRAEERAYYAVTCTVANASSTANADVSLFSERCHTHAQHLVLAPGETKTFAWSVELAPNYFKTPAKYYYDNAINVVVAGENAALAALTVVKQPQTPGRVRGGDVANMNVGKTMWLCDDSTGTDQRCDTPYFALQNYAGVGSGLSRWAPAGLSIRNQGEGGLATSANTHRTSCLLKPGDYLYVEYGHNEGSAESYKENLEKYFDDANAAGAYLVIVSPLERHFSWDAAKSKWNRSLQEYAEAGEAWVESKIAAGAKNVAFIDLNKPFADWMNDEIVRINAINPSIPLKNAIDYYFFSAKGGRVDATHPNNAGADWGAYLVWSNAVERVAAGEAGGATGSQRVQAAVLKGITEGVAAALANDRPWLVTDEIINAGRAPNSYWDASVRAGFDYANDAAVAAVDARSENGAVTLDGVTMRVMNHCNYTKAVVDIVSAGEAVTNRWYSYYNYDASGNTSGELVVPEVPGFIDADLGKDDPGIASHVLRSLTVPVGAKAYIWFAEADGNTWQVGGSAPCSAKYPLEAWTSTLLDDDTGSDGAGYARELESAVSGGRLRVSFKARYDAGTAVFALGNNPILTLNGSSAVFGERGPDVTLSADVPPVAQATVNSGEWMDVDMIVDLDARVASASVGGSGYRLFAVPDSFETPCSSFVMTFAGGDGAGAVDDVKILALEPSKKLSVRVDVEDAAFGSVSINGVATGEAAVYAGYDVVLSAVSAEEDQYSFAGWADESGNIVSVKKTLVFEKLAKSLYFKAVFRRYAEDEDRVAVWDFSQYSGGFSQEPDAAAAIVENGMTFMLQKGDTLGGSGVVWYKVAVDDQKALGKTLSETDDHYIKFTPPSDGTLRFVASIDSLHSKYNAALIIKAADAAGACGNSGDARVDFAAAGANYTLELGVKGGTTYYVWSYSWNAGAGGYSPYITISSITYTYALVHDAAFYVPAGETRVQTGAIEKAENVEKAGGGTLVLLGNNDFAGPLLVSGGTLRLGGAADIPGALYDFDASADGAVVEADGVFTSLKDALGSQDTLVMADGAAAPTLVTDAFGGRPSLHSEQLRLCLSKAFKTSDECYATFLVWRMGANQWPVPMGDANDSSTRWCVRRRNSNSTYYTILDYNTYYEDCTWGNGAVNAAIVSGQDQLIAVDGSGHMWLRHDGKTTSRPFFGSNSECRIGEVVMSRQKLTDAEREAVEAMLMAKWAIGGAAYTPIPPAAGVEVASGATLDLGGFVQHAASLSVAAGGVVTNGTLVVHSRPVLAYGAHAAMRRNGDGTWNVTCDGPTPAFRLYLR